MGKIIIEFLVGFLGMLGFWGCYVLVALLLFSLVVIYIGRRNGTLKIQPRHKHDWKIVDTKVIPLGDSEYARFETWWECSICGKTDLNVQVAYL